jgi:integrase
MAKTRPPKIPNKPVPVLPDEDVRRLPADCSGKHFRDRRDLAIHRLFLDTGMRLEGMAGRVGPALSALGGRLVPADLLGYL